MDYFYCTKGKTQGYFNTDDSMWPLSNIYLWVKQRKKKKKKISICVVSIMRQHGAT